MSARSAIAIIGAGSWGTALAIVLAPRFERIRLWAREADLVERMFATRVNDIFLPGFALPLNVEPTANLGYALEDAAIVIGVMPSRFARLLYRQMLPHLKPEHAIRQRDERPGTGHVDADVGGGARRLLAEKFAAAHGRSFRANLRA